MNRRNIFNHVSSLSPGKSVFDLSYEKIFDCDMGQLIPVLCEECVPGDFFKIGNQVVVRFQPLVAPILHEINLYVHYFFVPYRLLWNAQTREDLTETGDWEEFITGGADGANADTLPRWTTPTTTVGSLWDYMGLPTGVTPNLLPMDFPRRAYNFIYNEFYRDETLQTERAWTAQTIAQRNWEKDYFTSALPWQQRGTAPALPISGTSSAVWAGSQFQSTNANNSLQVTDASANALFYNSTASAQAATNWFNGFNNNTVDLSTATTFDVADLRLAFQIQKWMERNARSGARYTEFLRSHFGISPRDDRLQRPEYIGGSLSPLIISEVLQTESSDASTPQGTLTGHGIGVSESYCGKYSVKEFGVMIGLMSIMPRTVYQQGVNRQWLRETKYDFYFPEFANLSEQAIINEEIYADGTAGDENIFGYQGRYDELRTKSNMVCGQMRSTFDYWHISRQFSATPTLNSTFITCDPRDDAWAVPSEPQMIVSFGNVIKAFRPIPVQSEPGLIDHS
jgi:hypothetical protein